SKPSGGRTFASLVCDHLCARWRIEWPESCIIVPAMKAICCPNKFVLAFLALAGICPAQAALTLTNPIVFVTQPPIARELNSSVSNTFLSVVTEFGNHLADTAHAGRGGDLWLMTTNLGLVNLTRKGGFGTNGNQAGVGIDVRDPAIHWGGRKVLFSMVVGTP